jgi:hypothetical protein
MTRVIDVNVGGGEWRRVVSAADVNGA